MRPQVARTGVTLTVCVTAVLIVATLALIVVAPDAPVGNNWGFRGFAALFAIAFGAVGTLISFRVPGNRIGPLTVAIGLSAAVTAFCVEYAAYGLVVSAEPLPFALAVGWLVSWAWVTFAGMTTTFLVLLFPDGRLPSASWRPVAVFAGASIALLCLSLSLHPGPITNAPYLDNPVHVPTEWGPVVGVGVSIGFVSLAVAILLSAASMIRRFARSRGVARQQLKWFAAAATFAGLCLAGPGTLGNVLFTGDPATSSVKAFEILTIFALLTIPIAVGVAILRYRLYEIDRIISRTIGWALVTGGLAVVFVASVVALQVVLAGFTQSQTIAVAASTLVAFALFQPLRGRVQRVIDRRFDRARYDAEQTSAAFAGRLRDEVDIDAVASDLRTTVASSIRPAELQLWLREPRGNDQ
jgi:hypothetical protein